MAIGDALLLIETEAASGLVDCTGTEYDRYPQGDLNPAGCSCNAVLSAARSRQCAERSGLAGGRRALAGTRSRPGDNSGDCRSNAIHALVILTLIVVNIVSIVFGQDIEHD